MPLALSTSEQFLAGFHDANPGVTPRVFAGLPATMAGRTYPSCYDCLASVVPAGAAPTAVVDVACGDGFLLSLLAARKQVGLSLAGVDISSGELDAARRRLGAAAVLHQARAQALPLPDACADAVLCHMALMLMDDAPRVLAEVRRILGPQGIFCAVVGGGAAASPAHEVFVSLLRRYRKLPEFESLRLGDRRLNTPEGIAELFQPSLGRPVVADIVLQRRLGPAGLWDWFAGMYDLAWLNPADREEIGQRCARELAPLCDADGTVQHMVRLRRITVSGDRPCI